MGILAAVMPRSVTVPNDDADEQFEREFAERVVA
jgi:hypothetical protein